MSADDVRAAINGAVEYMPPRKPQLVITNGESLTTQVDSVIAALQALDPNDEHAVFGRGDDLVQVVTDPESKLARLRALDTNSLPGVVDPLVKFVKETKDGLPPAFPPRPVIIDILARRGSELPRLRQLLTAPVVLEDGRLLLAEGYDSDSRLYLRFPPGFGMPAIPEHPSQGDAERALARLDDYYVDFPFASQADHDNAVGELIALLTRVCRPLMGPGCASPMFLHDGTVMGSSKGKLANLIAIIATGPTR